jgi:GTP-binding protein LepA
MDHNLEIIPVINKIDLPSSEPERVLEEIESVLGYKSEEVLHISAKTGQGVPELLEAIVNKIPPPKGTYKPLRALIFYSHYDSYMGVWLISASNDGSIRKGDKLRLMGQGTEMEVVSIGYFNPKFFPTDELLAGDIGYIATGLKSVGECRVGDTVTSLVDGAGEPLIGYKTAKPVVYTGIYTTQPEDHGQLREAIEKLSLNDASFSFEPENSPVLGNGYRCGFLGLLHMDIIQERLEREFDLSLIVTVPGVKLIVTKTDGSQMIVVNPSDLPEPTEILKMEEPWVKISVITPSTFIGPIMDLVTQSEGVY